MCRIRFAKEWMRREEERRARGFLRQSFRCDRVADMEMRLDLSDVRAAPMYFPVFVFRSTHFGNKLRTFVSGPPLPLPFRSLTSRGHVLLSQIGTKVVYNSHVACDALDAIPAKDSLQKPHKHSL